MRWLAVCLVAASLGCDDFFYVCPTPDSETLARLPERLSETGLYADISTGEIAGAARPYQPRFELWGDGAQKQRWIMLPEGERIDTSNPDNWQFPIGTRVFKEFSSAGVRIETRLLERRSDGSWAALSYRWRDDGSDADAAALGAIDARGTEHDIPGAGECVGCHGGRASFVLGYSAIQLFPDQLDADVLTELPGDLEIAGEPDEIAALGYLHANCGHCHNADRPGSDQAPCMDPRNELDFWLLTDRLDEPETTPAVLSALAEGVITPGDPDDSLLLERITTRDLFYRMPPLGSEQIDREAAELLRRWIERLEP